MSKQQLLCMSGLHCSTSCQLDALTCQHTCGLYTVQPNSMSLFSSSAQHKTQRKLHYVDPGAGVRVEVVVLVVIVVVVIVVVVFVVVVLVMTMPGSTHWHLWLRTSTIGPSHGSMSSSRTAPQNGKESLAAREHSCPKLWQNSLQVRNTRPW